MKINKNMPVCKKKKLEKETFQGEGKICAKTLKQTSEMAVIETKHRVTNSYSMMKVVRSDLGRSGKNFNVRQNMLIKSDFKSENNVRHLRYSVC